MKMVDGPKWLLERGNPDVYVLCLGSKPFYRFVDALWGFKERIILTNRPVDSRREAVWTSTSDTIKMIL